jgi:hypothetical protein
MTSTTDATREQLMDALKERDKRIEELEEEVESLRFHIRAALNMLDDTVSRPSVAEDILREALAAVEETDDD